MLSFDLSFIYGMSVGFELADSEIKEFMPELVWGFVVDLLIFRISVYKITV
jgi:hypothetical protein